MELKDVITVNEIDKILDDALSDYKLGKIQYKNIIFIGNDGIGSSSRINKWIEAHSGDVTPVYLAATTALMKEENGILVKDLKDGKPQYVLNVPVERLSEDGTVGICENLNYFSDECIQPLEEIFTDRTYCYPGMNDKHDLHKLFLIIATAYPDDCGCNVADISKIKRCSDVYTVTQSVGEFKDYFDNNMHIDIDRKNKIENFKKMKVVVKNPNEAMKVIEVADLKEINKIVGNVDKNGEGLDETGSDFRQGVFDGIDIHMNGMAVFNPELPENFWDARGSRLYRGSVVFAGYDPNDEGFGVCSLTDNQIKYLKENINKIYDIY